MKELRVVGAIILKNGYILATQRKSGSLAGGWEFPGGKIEPGETPEEALIREIHEELDVSISNIEFFAKVTHEYDDFKLDMDCFTCTIESGKLELHDHTSAKWLDAEHLYSVDWLPADIALIPKLQEFLQNRQSDSK